MAVHTTPERVVFMSDTASYTSGMSHFGWHATKVRTFPHLDAAVAAKGDRRFWLEWGDVAQQCSYQGEDFDAFLNSVARQMRPMADRLARAGCETGTGFAAGYSGSRQAFRTVIFGQATGWELVDLDPIFCTPSPMVARPSDHELALVRSAWGAAGRLEPEDEAQLATWCEQPPLTEPTTIQEWVDLAWQARQRGFLPAYTGLKAVIGGRAYLTVVERGVTTERLLLPFDDTGWEFALMATGSLHPWGQVGPCWCGSGVRELDCCIPEKLALPCGCESAVPLSECCLLPESEVEDAARGRAEALAALPAEFRDWSL